MMNFCNDKAAGRRNTWCLEIGTLALRNSNAFRCRQLYAKDNQIDLRQRRCRKTVVICEKTDVLRHGVFNTEKSLNVVCVQHIRLKKQRMCKKEPRRWTLMRQNVLTKMFTGEGARFPIMKYRVLKINI